MKKHIFLFFVLLCVGGTLFAQIRTTRSVTVKRTRIQTEYQYFVRCGVGSLDLNRRENVYGRRSSLPFGGVIDWGFRKPFNNANLSFYWGMEYGLTSYSTALYSYYGDNGIYHIYTSNAQSHSLPNENSHPYFSVYSHALNATPLMIGVDYKVTPDISVDMHVGFGLNMTLFGRFIYDHGDSYNIKHGDGTFGLGKNNGDNQRLYGDIQIGAGAWWRNFNFELTMVAVPRHIYLSAEVPYDYVTYNQYGSNQQSYTSSVSIRGDNDLALQLLARVGISF